MATPIKKNVCIRAADEERALLRVMAEGCGISRSAFVRKALQAAFIREADRQLRELVEASIREVAAKRVRSSKIDIVAAAVAKRLPKDVAAVEDLERAIDQLVIAHLRRHPQHAVATW